MAGTGKYKVYISNGSESWFDYKEDIAIRIACTYVGMWPNAKVFLCECVKPKPVAGSGHAC